MAKSGFGTITISMDEYVMADDDARSEDRSLSNYIKHLIKQEHRIKLKTEAFRKEDLNLA